MTIFDRLTDRVTIVERDVIRLIELKSISLTSSLPKLQFWSPVPLKIFKLLSGKLL